jgi:hypothetical protein
LSISLQKKLERSLLKSLGYSCFQNLFKDRHSWVNLLEQLALSKEMKVQEYHEGQPVQYYTPKKKSFEETFYRKESHPRSY